MDTVVFTGRIAEHELKGERGGPVRAHGPRRPARCRAERPPPTAESQWFGWVVGGAALVLGIVAIVLIVYGVLHDARGAATMQSCGAMRASGFAAASGRYDSSRQIAVNF